MPELSFVLPTWNNATYLAETLDTFKRQKYDNFEVVIVDDGSTDTTHDLLTYISENDTRFVNVHNLERKGAAYCRNIGNRLAQSDIVCVADSGDLYHDYKVSATLRYFKKHPEVDVMYHSVIVADLLGQKHYEQKAEPYTPGTKINFSHPTVAYRKDIAQNYRYREGNLDTDQYEAFFLELAKEGKHFGFIPEVFLIKREIHGGRDMKNALVQKRKIYEEFGIPLPEFLQKI